MLRGLGGLGYSASNIRLLITHHDIDLISAGIILILAEMNDIKLDTPDPQRRAAAWNQCSETLQRMVDVHPSARDRKIALNGLMQRHLSHETHGER
ncbi:hypothetical protein N7449_008807 [Penicillium cf. viridicatum]|uniref:Uncharacterized protein n=1 Tax=Penicillium cf. viridicatum TaxID=2972119 RepID=A0A9W9J957_9EURO|nr:hypothetical protein N7449_008807 [Penicillium cf. viridicatum]